MKGKEVVITTIIGKGAECDGDFSAQGSARIDGCVNGNVTVTGKLIVGPAGSVQGDITAATAMIGGEVNGSITAPERVELTATAKVIGNVTTGTIVIDEKAVFQGHCDMNQEETGRKTRVNGRALRAGRKSAKAAIAEALKEVAAENAGEAAQEAAASSAAEQPQTPEQTNQTEA